MISASELESEFCRFSKEKRKKKKRENVNSVTTETTFYRTLSLGFSIGDLFRLNAKVVRRLSDEKNSSFKEIILRRGV